MIPTAVVLSHNSSQTIKDTLDSLAWCKEIIVVDDYSTDNTLKIAEKRKLKIYQRNLSADFATQRNFALSKVSSDWVLFIDSDEIVSPDLRDEILNLNPADDINGYYLPRLDVFLGKKLKHGETGDASFLRLGRVGKGRWHRPVHEYWQIEGKTKKLKTPILHQRDISPSQFIDRLNHYTDIDAEALIEEGKSFHYRDLLKPPLKFIDNYFLKLGFLDAFPGFVMAFLMSVHSLAVRVKTWQRSTH